MFGLSCALCDGSPFNECGKICGWPCSWCIHAREHDCGRTHGQVEFSCGGLVPEALPDRQQGLRLGQPSWTSIPLSVLPIPRDSAPENTMPLMLQTGPGAGACGCPRTGRRRTRRAVGLCCGFLCFPHFRSGNARRWPQLSSSRLWQVGDLHLWIHCHCRGSQLAMPHSVGAIPRPASSEWQL